MKIVNYETFVRMPKGTIFAAWTPHIMLTDPEIKIDPGREWLVYEQNGEKKMTWGYNGTCPIIPHVVMDDGFDYGPVKTDFFFYDGDSNDTAEYKMFLIFEEEDIENMIKVLEWAKKGCPGTDDPNEMLEQYKNA